MEHTEKCKARRAKYELDNAKFSEKWPNYCVACDATGEICWQENMSPLGSGRYWPMDMCEPCDSCSEQGVCPRCGKSWGDIDEVNAILEDSRPCPHCGWNWGVNEDDYAPIEPECFCWMEDWEDVDTSHYDWVKLKDKVL